MATKGISLREWSLDRSDYDSDMEFREAVAAELASFEHIGERLGVGLVALPARERGSSGEWLTRGWVFKTATVPAVTVESNGEITPSEIAPDELEALVAAVPEAE